jgi:uncharacterized phosphatase
VIYFVRHGQTDTNIKTDGGTAASEDDAPLNATGIKQAKETAKTLKDVKFDIVLTSPYKRAVQTAEIINKYHNAPLIVEADLRERNAGYIDMKLWHEAFDFDKNIQVEGDSVKDFFERVYSAIDAIKEKYADKNVLVVAHGGVNHGFYAYFNELPWQGNLRIDRMHNGDLREYEFKEKK